MKVISSNIRFDNPSDEFPWEKRKLLLSEYLLEYSPDIIATQEGRNPQIQELNTSLKHMQLLDGHREWIDERMYPCLFFNPAKIDILESGDIWLSKTPTIAGSKSFNSAFPRLCTWAKISYKNAPEILVVNTHLDHLESITRQEQIKVLANEIQSKINFKNIILLGDFNESPSGEVRKILNHDFKNYGGLQDPWSDFNHPEETSYHKFRGIYPEGKRIDWILHSNSIKAKAIQLEKRHLAGMYPSDHFPVIAEFDL